MGEDRIQEVCAAWWRVRGLCGWHTPNGGWRDIATGKRLRTAGVEPGVPDIIIAHPCVVAVAYTLHIGRGHQPIEVSAGHKGALALELKGDAGRLSPEQRAMLRRLAACDWAVHWTRGLDEALAVLDMYYPG